MFKYLSVILFILFSTPLSYADEAADKAEFKRLYAEFNDLYANSEELDPIIEVAEKVYESALKAYGEDHMNTAVVTYNLASLYVEKGESYSFEYLNTKAASLFEQYFDLLDKRNTNYDFNYIVQYLKYIKALASDESLDSIKSHTRKIRNLAKENNLSVKQLAELEFTMAIYHFRNNDGDNALDYFEKANEYYTEEYGPEHLKVGESAFWIAKIEMAKNKRETAESYFLSALDIFEKNKELGNGLSQSTHAFLVGLYEDMGRSDDATRHCQAVAEERPRDFDRHIKPLYRKNPVFPELRSYEYAKIKKDSVEVLLEFDVDQNGYTRNVKVIESENNKFNENSINAAEGCRYAPSVKNGELVETKGARLLISYKVAK